MRFLLAAIAAAILAPLAFADDGFYVVRQDSPTVSIDLKSFRGGADVQIIGPWHNNRTVLYETLPAPTRKQIETALAKAKTEWKAANEPRAVAGDALDEVNAARAQRGLKPFARDEGLTRAAQSAASHRAAHAIGGHTENDFAHLPSGCSADAAGCACWNVGDGWGACCTYEDWPYAGAAAVVGKDGRRYMHLFVSRTRTVHGAKPLPQSPIDCPCNGCDCGPACDCGDSKAKRPASLPQSTIQPATKPQVKIPTPQPVATDCPTGA